MCQLRQNLFSTSSGGNFWEIGLEAAAEVQSASGQLFLWSINKTLSCCIYSEMALGEASPLCFYQRRVHREPSWKGTTKPWCAFQAWGFGTSGLLLYWAAVCCEKDGRRWASLSRYISTDENSGNFLVCAVLLFRGIYKVKTGQMYQQFFFSLESVVLLVMFNICAWPGWRKNFSLTFCA